MVRMSAMFDSVCPDALACQPQSSGPDRGGFPGEKARQGPTEEKI